MSKFLYPRTIAVHRLPGDAVAEPGLQAAYQRPDPAVEAVVLTGLPASIQFKALARATGAEVPADAQRTNWDILLPARAAGLGAIRTRDIIVDDQGTRYQVIAPYWGPMGYRCRCERLEA